MGYPNTKIVDNSSIITEGINRDIVTNAVGSDAPTLPIKILGTKHQWTLVPSLVDGRGIDPDDFSESGDTPTGEWNESVDSRIFAGAGGKVVRVLGIWVASTNDNIAFVICDHNNPTVDVGDLAHFNTVTFTNEGTGTPVTITRTATTTVTDTINGILIRKYFQAPVNAYNDFGAGTGLNSEIDIA